MNIQKITSIVFFAIAGLVTAVMVIPSLPIKGNYKIMAVLSGSMEPKIMTGGLVMVKPAPTYRVGDVISFSTNDGRKVSTTHRIVEINTQGSDTFYTTKGDANNAPDSSQVNARDVIGKVILALPYAGYLLAFVRQPMGFVAAVVIPSSMVVLDEAQNVWQELYGSKSRYRLAQKIKIDIKPRAPRVYKIKVKELL